MPLARSQTVDPDEIQLIHTWTRNVRRSFICGYDELLGIDYEHRREWFRDREEFLASIYAIDIITFAIMHNHHHQLLRTRPDIVKTLTNEQVIRRLMKLEYDRWFFPDGSDRKSTKGIVHKRINDPAFVQAARRRLSDVSKFMQSLNQHIAKKANAEDGCSGSFFEQRFGHEVLADTSAVLACKMYIDLNPIRASMASTPEESEFTGVYERINGFRMFLVESGGDVELRLGHSSPEVHQWERLGEGTSAWLSPIEIDERLDPIGPDIEPSGRRASRKGVLPMPLLEYLDLLDFTGRRIRSDKRGAIPPSLNPILKRIGIAFDGLVRSIEKIALRHQPYFESTERKGRPDRRKTEFELAPS